MREEEQQRMRKASFKIVIRRIERPFSGRPEDELGWICESLGFCSSLDKEPLAAEIFKEIMKATENQKMLTSTALSRQFGMSRGAVINQLNNLMRAGLITRHGRCYEGRSPSIYRTIEEIEADVERIFERMKRTAKQLDNEMGVIANE